MITFMVTILIPYVHDDDDDENDRDDDDDDDVDDDDDLSIQSWMVSSRW